MKLENVSKSNCETKINTQGVDNYLKRKKGYKPNFHLLNPKGTQKAAPKHFLDL